MILKTIKRVFKLLFGWVRQVSPVVFIGAAVSILTIIIYGAFWSESAGLLFNGVLNFISKYFGWYYIITVFFFLVFVVWLFFSRFGKIRLGGDKAKPEFTRFGWFSMLFAAGMGMGLVFWGVAEPIMHYHKPPMAEPQSIEAFTESMRFSFFHWGFHPWAVYIIFALGISYFHFRHKLPLAPRSLFYPIIGDRIFGNTGHVIDIFCTVGTLLGVATSLGLGAMQVNSGISALTGIPVSSNVQVIIIAIITVIAVVSLVTGLHRGIKFLSMTNIILMLLLLLFVFIAGPTLFQINVFVSTFGNYLQQLVSTSLWIDLRADSEWQSNWTLFYWGWWLSWCPFVGIFIARVSKGRTIREFIFFVLFIPTIITFFWFSVFGGTAMHIELFGAGGIAPIVLKNEAMALHALLSNLPIANITQWLGILLIIIFFITSSDSGSLVTDMITSGGNPHPMTGTRIFWGVTEGAAAAALLMAGGLSSLQAASISAGLPQSIIVIVCCFSLVKALRKDEATVGVPDLEELKSNE